MGSEWRNRGGFNSSVASGAVTAKGHFTIAGATVPGLQIDAVGHNPTPEVVVGSVRNGVGTAAGHARTPANGTAVYTICGTSTRLSSPRGLATNTSASLDEIVVANEQNVVRFTRPVSGRVNIAPARRIY